MTPDIEPEHPEEAGVAKKTPELAQIEAGSILAADAKPRLAGRGFSDDQIERWAQTYVAEVGSGDVDAFLEWIEERQKN